VLTPRHVTHMVSIEQLALELVLQQEPHGPPVHARGLHPDDGHGEAPQPVGQHQQTGRRDGELAELLPAPSGALRRRPARARTR
jgi:hypothetical protein